MLKDLPRAIYLKDYHAPDYFIDHVELRFELGETETLVHSVLSLRKNPAADPAISTLVLNGESLEPLELRIDDVALESGRYRYEDDLLTIENAPDVLRLSSIVRIHPEENTRLNGLYKSGSMFCSQCEAEGFRCITWFLDRPDVMSEFSTTIVADAARYPVLLSNGNRVDNGQLPDGRHWVRWHDPHRKPSYLFALVAGKLDFVEDRHLTPDGREVKLQIFTEPENIDRCEHAMVSLKKAMTWDEQVYGRAYDLGIYMIVAVNDFNMGAMENKGLNIFNSKFVLARPDTATDQDYQGIEGVIAHEYFHNWTGNRITCRDWFQLSLKEGFTVFRDQEFSADMGSRAVKRIEDVRMLRTHQFAEDNSPMAHPVRPDSYIEINNFYTVTVYEKGAEVVRMQHHLLGPELFRKATDLYFDRHDGQAVTTDDFVKCMEDASGRDLTQFKRWYSQAGTPHVRVKSGYNADSGNYYLDFSQTIPVTPGQKNKLPMHIPVAVGFLDENGNDIQLSPGGTGVTGGTVVLDCCEAEQRFEFGNVSAGAVPSLLRGFSAPVILEYDYTEAELTFLMSHDSDSFNRWNAGQLLFQRLIMNAAAESSLQVSDTVLDAVRSVLVNPSLDQSLISEMMTLPGLSLLCDLGDSVDIDRVDAARHDMLVLLASRLFEELQSIYRGNGEGERHYVPEASDIARRALKNRCLSYLAQSGQPEGVAYCSEQFRCANNMTDVIASLSAISHSQTSERDEMFAAFEKRWKTDPLVMDKWFSLQAMSRRPGVLSEVKDLMKHPAFSITNPNKVRSLIGAFCNGNLSAFHAIDGSGYRFLGDQVVALNDINPQIAARLLRALSKWQRFDPVRRELMKETLSRVQDHPGLSKNVYEIAEKSLDIA